MGSFLNTKDMQDRIMDTIKQCPSMILTFKSRYITDEMWEYAIAMEPQLFSECKEMTYNLATTALMLDGMNLASIDPIHFTEEQYRKLCRLAVEQNPKAIVAVPKEFRTDELRSYAYARDPSLLLCEKKLDEDMIIAILDHNPGLIRYVVNPTDEMMIKALSKDPRTVVYFVNLPDKVKEFFEETYPDYAAMYLHD